MTEMERLITQDKVMAVMGAYQSGVTEVVSQVAEKLPGAHDNSQCHVGFPYISRI